MADSGVSIDMEVKCQKERTQALNRYSARRLLLDKIEALSLRKRFEERQRIDKLRRQRRPRPQKLKLKILEAKRRHAQKKALRAPVREAQ